MRASGRWARAARASARTSASDLAQPGRPMQALTVAAGPGATSSPAAASCSTGRRGSGSTTVRHGVTTTRGAGRREQPDLVRRELAEHGGDDEGDAAVVAAHRPGKAPAPVRKATFPAPHVGKVAFRTQGRASRERGGDPGGCVGELRGPPCRSAVRCPQREECLRGVEQGTHRGVRPTRAIATPATSSSPDVAHVARQQTSGSSAATSPRPSSSANRNRPGSLANPGRWHSSRSSSAARHRTSASPPAIPDSGDASTLRTRSCAGRAGGPPRQPGCEVRGRGTGRAAAGSRARSGGRRPSPRSWAQSATVRSAVADAAPPGSRMRASRTVRGVVRREHPGQASAARTREDAHS